MSHTFLLAGGGTGGHIFPLVAVARALRAISPESSVVFVGTQRGLEKKILGDLGENLELLSVIPIKGGGISGAIRGIAQAARSLPQASQLVKRLAPSAVVSIGGYAAGPVSLMARVHGIPLAVLEPNSVMGLANRLLGPLACRAYTAYSDMAGSLRKGAIRQLGVPIRPEFQPREYQSRTGPLHILVLGGSQGAVTLNNNVPAAIGILRRKGGVDCRVTHQCGASHVASVTALYQSEGVPDISTVAAFITAVNEAIADADVVVQRSGASAVAEVCAVGRPSILIPYPYAAGDHQLRNAQAIERAGAAVCLRSADATAERIASELEALASAPERRNNMAIAARNQGHPGAAKAIAEDLLQLVEGR